MSPVTLQCTNALVPRTLVRFHSCLIGDDDHMHLPKHVAVKYRVQWKEDGGVENNLFSLPSSFYFSDWHTCFGLKYEGWNFNSGNYLFTTDTK